jgi:prolipoprotein diacylglyceryltransferase
MNSEIIGLPTDVPWAFIFEKVDLLPRHPAQLYESISCLLLFFILYFLYMKFKTKTPEGLLFGIFLIVCFGLRIVYEFFKENQEAFEEGMLFNMGQILSFPLVFLGIYMIYRALTLPTKTAKTEKV